MKKLPAYAKPLLLHGASITGNFTEGYFFVEERLYLKDANELFDFCKWIDSNIGGAASGNIDMLFASFKNPQDAALASQAKELADLIRQFKL